jgi:LysR family nod box-dependent transcriptional activator
MRFERLDLNLLVALDVLIEDRSVSLAAKRLFLSQPALSGALNRLREFFGDELLVPSGRQMILTAKAEELRGPVREALMLIRSRITTPSAFDPATADRLFSIAASDYAYNVLLARVMAEASKVAPNVKFELTPTGPLSMERFERGEVDLLITISGYLLDNHPTCPLYEDEHAVICWSGGKHANHITEQSFFDASHVVAFFGPERHPAFTETYFAQQGLRRHIAVRLPTFAGMPQAVIGTDHVATMYRRHAEYFAAFLPIVIHEPPVAMPRIREDGQWHSTRKSDHGLQWLIDLVRRTAADVDASASRKADSSH